MPVTDVTAPSTPLSFPMGAMVVVFVFYVTVSKRLQGTQYSKLRDMLTRSTGCLGPCARLTFVCSASSSY